MTPTTAEFFVERIDANTYQVRENHAYLGIEGGSGLIDEYTDRDLALADAEIRNVQRFGGNTSIRAAAKERP